MGYYISKELFSSESPNGVYTRSLKLCKNDTQVNLDASSKTNKVQFVHTKDSNQPGHLPSRMRALAVHLKAAICNLPLRAH